MFWKTKKTFNAIVGRPSFVGAAAAAAAAARCGPALLSSSRAARPTRAGGSISMRIIHSCWKGLDAWRESDETRGAIYRGERGQKKTHRTPLALFSTSSEKNEQSKQNRPLLAPWR